MNKRNLCLMLSFLILLFISSNCFAEPNPFTLVTVTGLENDGTPYYLFPQGEWYELKESNGGSILLYINSDNENENSIQFAYLGASYTFTGKQTSDAKRVVFSMLRNGEPCGEPMAADLASFSTKTFTFLDSGCGFRFTAEWAEWEHFGFSDVEIHQVWFTKQEIDKWKDEFFKRVEKPDFMKLRARIDSVSAQLRVLEITDPQYFTRFEGAYASGGKYGLDEDKTDKRNGVVITKNGVIKAIIRAPNILGRDIAVYKPANNTEDFSIEKWSTMDRIHGALDTKFIRVPAEEGLFSERRVLLFVSGDLAIATTVALGLLKGKAVAAGVASAGLSTATGLKAGAVLLKGIGSGLGATGIGLAIVGAGLTTAYFVWDNTKLINYKFDLDGDSEHDLQVSWDKELWSKNEARIDLITYLDSESAPTPPVTPPAGGTGGVWVSEHSNLPSTYDARNLQVKINGSDWTAVKRLGANKLLIYNLSVGSTYNAEYFLPGGQKITETIKPVQTLKKEEIDAIG